MARALVRWFEKNARELPWRQKRTPYRVWLSEIMLQQTRVESVIPYFLRFTQKWPTLADLAEAPLDHVLHQWEGLGYYSRARNLHKTAQLILHDYDEEFPQTPEALKKLPGIGSYSAGAIASLAYNLPAPAIDGNVCRVMGRLFAKKIQLVRATDKLFLEKEILEMIPPNQASLFNEALMELGATLCTPRNPHCLKCPLKKHCKAFRLGNPEKYPGKAPSGIAVILNQDRVLLWKNPNKGLLAELWAFPHFSISKKKTTIKFITEFLDQKIQNQFHVKTSFLKSLKPFEHKFTHILMSLYPQIFQIKKSNDQKKLWDGLELDWVSFHELTERGLPRAHRKIAETLGQVSDQ